MAGTHQMLAVPTTRVSGFAVPMTKASALSVPISRTSRISAPTSKHSRVRGSEALTQPSHDSKSFMNQVNKSAEVGVDHMSALITLLAAPDRGGSRISYTNTDRHILPKSTHVLIEEAEKDRIAGKMAVCVIENISPSVVRLLGPAWDLPPQFFAMHASNPPRSELWQHLAEWKPPTANENDAESNFDCLNGIYEFHDLNPSIELLQQSSTNYCQRHIFKNGEWPVNVSTKITYAKVFSNLYIFLVDPPTHYERAFQGEFPQKVAPTVRFPYAQNLGGVLLPSPFMNKDFIPFNALEQIFRHAWQLDLLLQPATLFPNVPLLYLMSFSLWYSRLHRLDKEIKRISFNDIRDPDLRITDTLHDLREDLSMLQNAVADTQYYACSGVGKYYGNLWEDFTFPNMLTPLDGLVAISKNADTLHRFLLETFQLCMNTITVRDSQMSIRQTYQSLKQTRQSNVLTKLATFYLPWTLASGIYGMNLKELNNSGLGIWTFGLTGTVLVVGTVMAFQLQTIPRCYPDRLLDYLTLTWWSQFFWQWRQNTREMM